MSDLIERLTGAMEGLTVEQAWSDNRFKCIHYQPTVGPMAMDLMTDICINKVPLVMALNDNEYNDYQVMVSVYDNTLHVWAEAEIERLTEHRDELQDCNAKLQARVEALEGAIQKNPCLVLVAQGVPYHDCFPLEPCDPCHCGKDLLAATEQGESNHTMTEHTEFCEAWRGRVCTCAATEQGEGDE